MATKGRRGTTVAARMAKANGSGARVGTRRAVRRATSRPPAGPIPRAIAVAVASGETISVGVLKLVKSTLVTVGAVATQAVKGTMQAAGGLGGDFEAATRSAVKVGGEAGADVGAIALNAARGALHAADRVGSAAGRAVRTTLDGTVAGVRSLVATPPPRRPLAVKPSRRAAAKTRKRPKERVG